MALAISIRNLSKSYVISQQEEKHSTLTEMMISKLRNPRSIIQTRHETFNALKEVSFDIQQSDVVGIIGRNGAGKSTLLKILSRITEPTSGEIDLYGRVGSLLEVGTGFHPELSGRENIFLNGAILGMSKAEIRNEFDAIVDFAGVEKFLETPVKRYSSGMYVRLAFAVAAHLRTEILIVDEVLAVGDMEFQKKCLGKMQDVSKGGRTVLFVSHNMAAVHNLCNKSVLLEKGVVRNMGKTSQVIEDYYLSIRQNNQNSLSSRPKWATPCIQRSYLRNSKGEETNQIMLGERFEVVVDFSHPTSKIANVGLGVLFNHHSIGAIGGINNRMLNQWPSEAAQASGQLRFTIIDFPGLQGLYSIDLYLADGDVDIDMMSSAIEFEICDSDIYGTGRPPMRDVGAVFLNGRFSM